MENKTPIYQRILIKLSGEILQGNKNYGIDINVVSRIAKEIKDLVELGIQIGLVIGGGNIFRGEDLIKIGINRIYSDYIGMLSTIINGLIMYDSLQNIYSNTCLVSSIPFGEICKNYNLVETNRMLCNNYIIIFTSGIGNPLFTTDSAACLRGIEIQAEIVLKATKVDGVFSADPTKYKNTKLYKKLSYQEALKKELKIMDLTAFTLARDYNLPICVFNINIPGILSRIVMGEVEGTMIN